MMFGQQLNSEELNMPRAQEVLVKWGKPRGEKSSQVLAGWAGRSLRKRSLGQELEDDDEDEEDDEEPATEAVEEDLEDLEDLVPREAEAQRQALSELARQAEAGDNGNSDIDASRKSES
eukprot:Skav201941  [mRNA]  locus=scaffold2764:55533:59203:- [translate_table: standard]